ncbi:MAG: KilA-N domain-containing protein [Saprospiraceae bacterium]
MANKKMEVQGLQIRIENLNAADYISLTDIARKNSDDKPANTIANWLRNQHTLLYLQTWEEVHNPHFKVVQMQDFRLRAIENRSLVSPKNYIEQTGAIGLISKAGKHGGGTFAHSEIALEFCTWLSPPFKVYFFKEFQRLKQDEFDRRNLEWHIRKITDNIDEVRNLLDTIPGQARDNVRIALPHEGDL